MERSELLVSRPERETLTAQRNLLKCLPCWGGWARQPNRGKATAGGDETYEVPSGFSFSRCHNKLPVTPRTLLTVIEDSYIAASLSWPEAWPDPWRLKVGPCRATGGALYSSEVQVVIDDFHFFIPKNPLVLNIHNSIFCAAIVSWSKKERLRQKKRSITWSEAQPSRHTSRHCYAPSSTDYLSTQ